MKKLLLAFALAFSSFASAQTFLGNLPAATTPLAGSEQIPLAQQGAGCPSQGCSRQATASQIAALAAGGVTSFSAGTTGLTPSSPSLGAILLGGTLNAASGGTGEAGTFTGITKANGTSAYTAALAADVVGLFSGCSGVLVLSADGACHSVTASPGGANTNIQFNSTGAFAGSNDFSWLSGSDTLLIGTTALPPTIVPNAVSATTAGVALTVDGGPGGSSSGAGGALNLNGGAASTNANTTASNGGAVNITAGTAAHTSGSGTVTGNGGAISITAGQGAGSAMGSSTGDGGSISITAGSPDLVNSGVGNGGSVTISGGTADGSGTAKNGGSITLTAGSGNGIDNPGNITIAAGATSTVGTVTVHAGQAQLLLKQQGTPEWSLGNNSATGNRLTGTSAGGVQIGSPTGADCGSGCLNVAGNIKVNNVSLCQSNGTNCPAAVTPGGSTTQVQYNNAGAFGGTSLTYANGTGDFTFSAPSSGPTLTINSVQANTIQSGVGVRAGFEMAGNGDTPGTSSLLVSQEADSSALIFNRANAPLGLGTNGATRVAVGAAGDVTVNTPTSGSNALTVNGVANSYAERVIAPNTTNLSLGLFIQAGTSSTADNPLFIVNAANTVNYFRIRGDGVIYGGGPIAGGLVDMTPDTGNVTLTLTGCTTSPTTSARFYRAGKMVVINIPKQTCTSNTTSFSVTGLPASLTPNTSADTLYAIGPMQDNAAETETNFASVNSSGTITFYKGGSAASNWTNIGTKGVGGTGTTGTAFTYSLD